METPNAITCPHCGSTQITANKKGFSAGKAIAGDLLLGPVGLLAGTAGRNKIIITCLNCGQQWQPGDTFKQSPKWQTLKNRKQISRGQLIAVKVLAIIFSIIGALLTLILFASNEVGTGVFFLCLTLLFVFLAVRKIPTRQ
jgi:predicted RNA-binding Zn-ribbon protein involved in translation (DUF1610 family)